MIDHFFADEERGVVTHLVVILPWSLCPLDGFLLDADATVWTSTYAIQINSDAMRRFHFISKLVCRVRGVDVASEFICTLGYSA